MIEVQIGETFDDCFTGFHTMFCSKLQWELDLSTTNA